MNARDLILRKREGRELSADEIAWLVRGFTDQSIPDYQFSAFLMATFFRDMSPAETVALTRSMLESGRRLSWSGLSGPRADKHSTGGVGDKVSLPLAPLAAACGLKVPMLSGRGLGHTGGTLDKLEAMHGYRTGLSIEEFGAVLEEVGCAIVGQSGALAPADGKIYALRDVTGTVECIPLIVASILSKKAAAGVETLVIDLKSGDGAFMRSEARALELARALVEVAEGLGMRCVALLTNMDEPLGLAVGNALEVTESVECLRGAGPPDLRELTLREVAAMLWLSGLEATMPLAYSRARAHLDDGSALECWRRWIRAQGAQATAEGSPTLDQAPVVMAVPAPSDGFVRHIRTYDMGLFAVRLGAGRLVKTDTVDPAVGLVLVRKVGDPVKRGEPLCWLHLRREEPALVAEAAALFEVGAQRVAPKPLVTHVVSREGTADWESWSK